MHLSDTLKRRYTAYSNSIKSTQLSVFAFHYTLKYGPLILMAEWHFGGKDV